MKTKPGMVRITTAVERVIHWIMAAAFIFALVSGLDFMYGPLNIVPAMFGSAYAAKWLHIFAGIIFGAAFIPAMFMWWRVCLFEPSDAKWMMRAGGYLWDFPDVPPAYRFNAGQKLFYWFVLFFGAGLVISGLLMANADLLAPAAARWAFTLHGLSAFVLGCFLMVHIYLGTIGNPGTIPAMLTGQVTRDYAATHYPRWLAEREGRKPPGKDDQAAA